MNISEHPLLFAEYATEKNPVPANAISCGSHDKTWWRCRACGNLWIAQVKSRFYGCGCPACSGRSVHSDGRNSMRRTHPNLATQFVTGLNGKHTPDNLIAGTNKKLWWRCAWCASVWRAPGLRRVKETASGCPVCAGKKIHESGENCLAVLRPDVAAELDEQEAERVAEKITIASGKMLKWRCKKCDHSWSTTVAHRTEGNGCPACSNKTVHRDGRNSLAKTHPGVAAEWHPTKNGTTCPADVTAGSKKRALWLCKVCDHFWNATVFSRTGTKKGGCPACSNKTIHRDGRNSLAKTHPDVAAEWHPTKNGTTCPADVTAGSSRSAWWLCSKCAYSWPALCYSRTGIAKTGCPACSGFMIKPDKSNSVAAATYASEFRYLVGNTIALPENIPLGTPSKIGWCCEACGNAWEATGNNRNAGRGCPNCRSNYSASEHLSNTYLSVFLRDILSVDISTGASTRVPNPGGTPIQVDARLWEGEKLYAYLYDGVAGHRYAESSSRDVARRKQLCSVAHAVIAHRHGLPSLPYVSENYIEFYTHKYASIGNTVHEVATYFRQDAPSVWSVAPQVFEEAERSWSEMNKNIEKIRGAIKIEISSLKKYNDPPRRTSYS